MRWQSSDGQGRPDLKYLASTYREARRTGDAILPTIEAAGRVATVSTVPKGQSSFGPRAKEAFRRAREVGITRICERLANQSLS